MSKYVPKNEEKFSYDTGRMCRKCKKGNYITSGRSWDEYVPETKETVTEKRGVDVKHSDGTTSQISWNVSVDKYSGGYTTRQTKSISKCNKCGHKFKPNAAIFISIGFFLIALILAVLSWTLDIITPFVIVLAVISIIGCIAGIITKWGEVRVKLTNIFAVILIIASILISVDNGARIAGGSLSSMRTGFRINQFGSNSMVISTNRNLSGVIVIPSQHRGTNITAIGRNGFADTSISTIIIPRTLSLLMENSFARNPYLTSIILHENIYISHGIVSPPFHSSNNVTIFAESSTKPIYWNNYWNASNGALNEAGQFVGGGGFRPIIWGVNLSEAGDFVVSFLRSEGNIERGMQYDGSVPIINAPYRMGYIFGGWAVGRVNGTVVYNAAHVYRAAYGSMLYAVWV
ncbi:MAG: leucine-rich repeat domain-containing protein [Firmicutes bacterium]|nr:leucine-rich repeat domain-containing protein [Bacillota bacterium]